MSCVGNFQLSVGKLQLSALLIFLTHEPLVSNKCIIKPEQLIVHYRIDYHRFTVSYVLLCGRLQRPHYASCPSVCPSVSLSVSSSVSVSGRGS